MACMVLQAEGYQRYNTLIKKKAYSYGSENINHQFRPIFPNVVAMNDVLLDL